METCRHCGEPIEYSAPDTYWLHQPRDRGDGVETLAWGSKRFDHENYNNGLYCKSDRTQIAEP